MKRMLSLALAFLLCVGAAAALAVDSPTLESFAGSGIRKTRSPGKLQKSLLAAMRKAGSTRLLDVITDRDTMMDASGNETVFRDAETEIIFTPEFYKVNQDGTADLRLRLADTKAFQTADGEKEVSVIAGIPKGKAEGAGVSYYEIPAEVKNSKVRASFPAAVVAEMRRSMAAGWSCVCMIVSRDAPKTPAEIFFTLPAEESGISV